MAARRFVDRLRRAAAAPPGAVLLRAPPGSSSTARPSDCDLRRARLCAARSSCASWSLPWPAPVESVASGPPVLFVSITVVQYLNIMSERDRVQTFRANGHFGYDAARPMTLEPLHRQLGLTDDELAAVVELLGREPTELELAMYAVMWSEHCSYKSSKRHLGRFPTEAPWVLVGPGEGAGVIDVGDGLAVAIRIESHNHPSAVEPYQGAATGVGGIIRDIFSMGARPIALMDPLRFGPLDDARTRYLFEGRRRRHQRLRQRGRRARPSAARSCSTSATATTRSSTCCASACCRSSGSCWPRPRASATSRCCSDRPPGATASAARACSRRPASTRAPRPSARRCRSATRSRRRGSSRRASSCSTPGSPSACRTSAPPASRARRRRPRRRPARAWTSTSRACPSASRA